MNTAMLRPAAGGDIAAITRIYGDAVTHGTASFELEPPDEAEMARRHQALLAGGYPYRARPAYRWCVEDSVYVAPNYHRRGVGRLLLARLVEECEQRGFRQMI